MAQILESALFYFSAIHLQMVSQIYNDPFTRGQPPIIVTGHRRILSYVQTNRWQKFRLKTIIQILTIPVIVMSKVHSQARPSPSTAWYTM